MSKLRVWQIIQIVFVGIPITNVFGGMIFLGLWILGYFFYGLLTAGHNNSASILYMVILLLPVLGLISLASGWSFLIRFVSIYKNPKIRVVHAILLLPGFVLVTVMSFGILKSFFWGDGSNHSFPMVSLLAWPYLIYCFYILLQPKLIYKRVKMFLFRSWF